MNELEADDIGKEWRTQQAFGPVSSPICQCGNSLPGYVLSEGAAVAQERKNEERVAYPATCGNCQRVKRHAFKTWRDVPRPRWSEYRPHPSLRGTRQERYLRQEFRRQAAKWVDNLRGERG